jgi:hypothetical protein
MSRAQDRSARTQSGAESTQRSTGNVSGSTGNVTGSNAGATSTSLRDQPTGRTETSTPYARGTGAQAGHRTEARPDTTAQHGLGGAISMLAGLLSFLLGLGMVVRKSFYPVLNGYAYRLNVLSWGWIMLALGIVLFGAGACYLLGLSFGRAAAVALAVLTAIGGFLVLPYTPIWGIIVVAVSALAIWALLSRSQQDRSDSMSL